MARRIRPALRRAVLLPALAVVAATLTVLPAVTPAAAAPRLEDGFVLRDIETGLAGISGGKLGDGLTDFAYLPDESILVAGKYGKVMWLPRTGAPKQIANIPTNGSGDLGLNGLEVHYRAYNLPTVTGLKQVAAELRLLPTGGTDYHGDRESYAEAHAQLWIPDEIAGAVRAALEAPIAG